MVGGLILVGEQVTGYFFANNCFFQVGNEHSISFWHAHWMEEGVLKNFSLLFSIFLFYKMPLLEP